jgi:hypothetical protein
MSDSPSRLVRARRAAGVLTACGALLASGLQAAPAARAEPTEARWGTEIGVRSFNAHSGSCTVESDGVLEAEGDLGGGDTVVRALDGDFTVSNPDAPTDTQTFAVAGESRWRLVDSGGTFESFRFSMDGRIAGSAALDDTECSSEAGAFAALEAFGEVGTAGFLELSLDTSDEMTATVAALQPGSGGASLSSGPRSVRFRGGGSGAVRAFVEPGEFFLTTYAEMTMDLPARQDDGGGPVIITRRAALEQSVAGSAVASVTFVAAGSAERQRGPGGRFVKLQARRCAADAVTAAFTQRAGKVERVVLSVDGVRKRTVRKVRAGRSVSIGRLGASDDVTVSAAVTLKSGATRTVSRSYVACSG